MSVEMDEVFAYVTGGLDRIEVGAFERRLTTDPTLQAEVSAMEEMLAALATTLPAAPPSPGLRDRVLRTARLGVWDQFAAAVAGIWDVAVERVRAEFSRAMDPESWGPSHFPGIRLFHLEGGPATATADVGIVAFPPGTNFAHHGHGASEIYVVLQGRLFDSSGRIELPGETVEYTPDIVHSFTTDPDQETVIALVLRGELLIPPPPR